MKGAQKLFIVLASAALTFVFSLSVFAAGGGGGGSGGSSPPPAPIPVPENPSPPAETTAPPTQTLICAQDTWTCIDWGACRMDGRQSRLCTLANDCPGVDTPPPPQLQTCPGLKCGHLSTLQERVKCRLQLTPDELSREYAALYFPEYCKGEEMLEEQNKCIALYRKWQPCWKMPFGAERAACGRLKTGLKKSLAAERRTCKKRKTAKARSACLERLNDKRENHVLFQMYEYEWQAEKLLQSGELTLQAAADFDVFVETAKQELERVEENTSAWNALLKKVQDRFGELAAS